MSLMVLFAVMGKAFGHDGEILKCDWNKNISKVEKLAEHINPNGTLSEAYDRNGDGNVDIEAISHMLAAKQENGIVVIEHSEHPFLYVVDLDYDGQPDAVYVDKSGVGKCQDIVLYEDLTEPHQENVDEKAEGRI